MGMKEWRVIIKTEKVINCLPDILYVRNGDGETIRLIAKLKVDTQLNSSCEYHLDETKTNPDIYILVHPYSVRSVYIKCSVDHDVIYEELVSYDKVADVLNLDVSKLISKHLYKK